MRSTPIRPISCLNLVLKGISLVIDNIVPGTLREDIPTIKRVLLMTHSWKGYSCIAKCCKYHLVAYHHPLNICPLVEELICYQAYTMTLNQRKLPYVLSVLCTQLRILEYLLCDTHAWMFPCIFVICRPCSTHECKSHDDDHQGGRFSHGLVILRQKAMWTS